MEYYIAADQQRLGPFTLEQLAQQPLQPETLIWHEGMPQWTPASAVPELQHRFQHHQEPQAATAPVTPPPGTPAPQNPAAVGYAQPGSTIIPPFVPGQSNRVLAGVFGIVLGALGIHKFIIGLNTPGIITLSITLGTLIVGNICCIFLIGPLTMAIIGCIEGIMYLSCTDEEFYAKYIVQKRQWF